MKRDFLTQPHSWTRAPRYDQTGADYASAITVHQAVSSVSRFFIVCAVAAAAVLCALFLIGG